MREKRRGGVTLLPHMPKRAVVYNRVMRLKYAERHQSESQALAVMLSITCRAGMREAQADRIFM